MRTHNRLCISSMGFDSISLRNQVDANFKIDFEADRNRPNLNIPLEFAMMKSTIS